MKHLIGFLGLLIGFKVQAQAYLTPEPLCVPQVAGRYNATINYGDRKITVIGWEHPELIDQVRLKAGR